MIMPILLWLAMLSLCMLRFETKYICQGLTLEGLAVSCFLQFNTPVPALRRWYSMLARPRSNISQPSLAMGLNKDTFSSHSNKMLSNTKGVTALLHSPVVASFSFHTGDQGWPGLPSQISASKPSLSPVQMRAVWHCS